VKAAITGPVAPYSVVSMRNYWTRYTISIYDLNEGDEMPNDNPVAVRFRWVHLLFELLLLFVSAFCLIEYLVIKYFGCAWVYSGMYGLPSQARTIESARHWVLGYFWFGLLAEAALIVDSMILLKLRYSELPVGQNAIIRCFVAVVLSGLGTFFAMMILISIGRFIHR
jgi:hypothetical protein